MKRVLVALDRSPRASTVLARAAAIAAAVGAELYVLYAIGIPTDVPAGAFRLSPNALIEEWRAQALRELNARVGSLARSQAVHVLVNVGSPWSAICAAAHDHDVDLIVVGSHGYDMLDHVLGTTAAKVVNHADRSVLVVREPPSASAPGAP